MHASQDAIARPSHSRPPQTDVNQLSNLSWHGKFLEEKRAQNGRYSSNLIGQKYFIEIPVFQSAHGQGILEI